MSVANPAARPDPASYDDVVRYSVDKTVTRLRAHLVQDREEQRLLMRRLAEVTKSIDEAETTIRVIEAGLKAVTP